MNELVKYQTPDVMTLGADTKRCPACGVTLPSGLFPRSRSTADGRYGYCKRCTASKSAAWRQAHPEAEHNCPKCRANQRAYKQTHRRRIVLRERHGMTERDYAMLLAIQGGGCAICARAEAVLCVDHDHESGNRRGLLCGACNRALGLFHDEPAALRRAADYLEGRL